LSERDRIDQDDDNNNSDNNPSIFKLLTYIL
jgi:hypothetical protein